MMLMWLPKVTFIALLFVWLYFSLFKPMKKCDTLEEKANMVIGFFSGIGTSFLLLMITLAFINN